MSYRLGEQFQGLRESTEFLAHNFWTQAALRPLATYVLTVRRSTENNGSLEKDILAASSIPSMIYGRTNGA